MSDVKVEFLFKTTLTQKEFSVMTRALAGHELKEADLALAMELNKRLLTLRLSQLSEYANRARRALEVALEESNADDSQNSSR